MKKLAILLFLGLVIRLLFIPIPGFAADIAYWKSWSLAAAEKGVVWTALETNYNYAPAFLYFLKGVGFSYRLLADPNNFQEYWQATNLPFLLVIKLPVILADLLTAFGIWWLLKREKNLPKLEIGNWKLEIPLLGATYYLFNPFIIFNGAYWGQVGSIGTGLILLALILIFKEKPIWAIGVATLAFLLKLQMMFYLPLLLLWIWKKFGWKKFVSSLAAVAVVFLLVSWPFLYRRHMERITSLILSSADYFPLLSLNAYNFWWLLAKGAGFTTSDRTLIFGITSAKFIGLFSFLVFYLLSLILLWQKTDKSTLFKSCLWLAFSFFILPTQMHERYIYPAFLFLALLIPEIVPIFLSKKRSITSYFYIVLLIILPLTTFYNLHNSLVINYPRYGLPLLDKLNLNSVTLLVSAIHLAFFLGLSLVLIKKMKSRLILSVLVLAVLLLFLKQAGFALADQVSLTKITPVYQHQDWGMPMKNLTVQSGWGPKSWNFLSSNYYFYRQGIGSHANSRLIYPLNGQFKRFSTNVGLDTGAGLNASVEFKIVGDGRLLYQSGRIEKFDLPRHADVSIEKVKNLELIIDDAGDGITDDHADWLNPMLYK